MLEALGMAGDITLYGKRDNVLVIREDGRGTKSFQRINLNTQELLKSPYYYLHSNDIIYVEPSKEKVNKERNAVLVPIFLSLTTLAIVIIDRVAN
jgi:polysaccharide export outer membrane protein